MIKLWVHAPTHSIQIVSVNRYCRRILKSECLTVSAPVVTADSTTATTISLSWTSGGSEGVSYEVDWQRVTTGDCDDEDEGNATLVGGSMTSYTVTGVQEDSNYTITVTASNSIGDEMSESITGETMTEGD